MSHAVAYQAELMEDSALEPYGLEPWEQQPGESDLWFSRFEEYRKLGPRRTVDAIYRRETGREKVRASGDWRDESQFRKWQERARAWDAAEREREREESEELRRAAKQARVAAIFKLHETTSTALETLSPAGWTVAEVRDTLKVAHAEMRQEFGETPSGTADDPVVVKVVHSVSMDMI